MLSAISACGRGFPHRPLAQVGGKGLLIKELEIALADTIGVGNPAQVTRLVERVRHAINPLPVRVHFHNTRGTGIANVWAAVEAGAGDALAP